MRISSSFKYMLLTAGIVSLTGCGLASMPKGYTEVEKQTLGDLDVANYTPRTASEREAVLTQDLFAQTAFWSREYELNPADLEAAINLSSTLRRLGNPGQSIEIATQTRALFPRNVDLMTELGASLIANNQAQKALKIVDGALRLRPQHARLWSMKGAALDQLEMYTQARQHYSKALQLTPQDPKIMTNVGLSYALEGDPRTAEVWLRRAVNAPGASATTRQNLALILGLQGKTEEADKWSRLDVNKPSASTQAANRQYMRQNIRGPISTPQPRGPARVAKMSTRQARPEQMRPAQITNLRTAPSVQQIPSQRPARRTLSAYSPQLSGGPKTASEAARLAAKQMSGQDNQSAPTPPPKNVLEKIAQNNRSKRDIAAQNSAHNAQLAQQRAAQYHAQRVQYQNSPAPRPPINGYNQANAYAQSPIDTRPPARTRRR